MIKSIIKELIITILLCVAIILILSILFYDYNPVTKVVPSKVAYTTPENIKNEIAEADVSNIITIENKIYTIEGSDLNIYKKSNSYNPGKANPFADTASSVVDTSTNTTGNTTGGNKSTNQTNPSANTNSVPANNNTTFFNNAGNK